MGEIIYEPSQSRNAAAVVNYFRSSPSVLPSFTSFMSEIEYISLFNKYRPMTFSHIIGQDVVVQTIRNAISKKQIPGSLLLYGSYGVGKTTIARIIARCINCDTGITENPCLKCDSCYGIARSSNPDVIEMDAASSTGVDDIRAIIENAKYSPILSRFKIYIIDEVHMLSNSAFNALLKTLEEPMNHVKFILATTELHKVPLTIISRCQRFKLNKVKREAIASNIKMILDKENKKYDEDGINLIASISNGSVRDSLSLVEKYLTYSGEITLDVLQEFADNDFIQIWGKVFSNDVKGLINIFNPGPNPIVTLNQMLHYLYFIVKIKLGLNFEDDDFYIIKDEEKELLHTKFSQVSFELLSRLWKVLDNGIRDLPIAVNFNASLEMLLIQLCYISSLPSPKEVIEQYIQNSNANDKDNSNFSVHTKRSGEIDNNIHTSDLKNTQNTNTDDINKITYSPNSIRTLFIQSSDFKAFFQSDVQKIGLINKSITLYVSNEVSTEMIRQMNEFLSVKLGSEWKIDVVNLQENTLIKKIVEEFPGTSLIE